MWRRALIAAGAVAVAGATTLAHVVVPAEFREVVGDAGLIVRGAVTDVRGVAAAGGGIDSVATVAVEEVLKGETDRFVSVRMPGGRLGPYQQVYLGIPQLRAGQRAVFFLRRGPDGFWRPVGLSMGIYGLRAERRTGAVLVQPPLLAGTTASAGRVLRGDIRRTALPVQEFEAIVRLVVAGAAQPLPPPRPPATRGGGER